MVATPSFPGDAPTDLCDTGLLLQVDVNLTIGDRPAQDAGRVDPTSEQARVARNANRNGQARSPSQLPDLTHPAARGTGDPGGAPRREPARQNPGRQQHRGRQPVGQRIATAHLEQNPGDQRAEPPRRDAAGIAGVLLPERRRVNPKQTPIQALTPARDAVVGGHLVSSVWPPGRPVGRGAPTHPASPVPPGQRDVPAA